MGGFLKFPFGEAIYYNTDDAAMVSDSVLKAANVASYRFGLSNISSVFPTVSSNDFSVGLFYLDDDNKALTKKFPASTGVSTFGYHKGFFFSLVDDGMLSGNDYESFRRGFTLWDGEVYLVIAGDWAGDSVKQNVCTAFGFPADGVAVLVRSPLYSFKNGDSRAGRLFPVVPIV